MNHQVQLQTLFYLYSFGLEWHSEDSTPQLSSYDVQHFLLLVNVFLDSRCAGGFHLAMMRFWKDYLLNLDSALLTSRLF